MPVIHGQKKTVFVKFRLSPNAAALAKQEADKMGLSLDELGQLRLLAGLLDTQKTSRPVETEAA